MELQEFYRKSLLISQFLSWLIFQATWFIVRKTSKEGISYTSEVNIYFLGPLSEENSQWKIRMLRPFSVWLFFWCRRWRIPSSVKMFSAPYKQSVRNLIKHSQKYVWYIKENSGFNNSNSMHMLMYEGSPINRRQSGFVFLHLFRGFN